MNLPFRQVRDADPGYALNVLLAFVERHNRNPDDTATLTNWWSLPLPIHQRLGILSAVAATYPEYAPNVQRAFQDCAVLAGDSTALGRIADPWTTQCDLIRLLIGAKDTEADLTPATARLDALVVELDTVTP